MADWLERFVRRQDKAKDAAARALTSIYKQAARELLGSLLLEGDAPLDVVRNGRILAQVLPLLQRLDSRATTVLSTLLLDAYAETRRDVFRVALVRAGDVPPPPTPGIRISFETIPEERVREAARASLEYVKGVCDDLRTKIRTQLGISYVRGESVRDLAQRIAGTGLTPEGGHPSFHTAEVRANVIARTETARIHSVTTEEAIAQIPGGMMEWSALLEGACKLCRDLDGQLAKPGELFVGRRYPGKWMVPRHPRCRCVIVPHIPKADATRPA
ncbi:Phage Mu protein F like protein [compost metagenome]